jgi:hypothetical protein
MLLPTSPTTNKPLTHSPRSHISPSRRLQFTSTSTNMPMKLVTHSDEIDILPNNNNLQSKMYQPSDSLHAFIEPQCHTPKVQEHPKTDLVPPENFKSTPCWKHLLNVNTKTVTLKECSWMDILCSGQHPKESREYINQARRSYNLPDLDPEVLILSELSEEEQLALCRDQMLKLGWRMQTRAMELISARDTRSYKKYSIDDNSNSSARIDCEEVFQLRSEIESLKRQLDVKLEKYRRNYSNDSDKANIELLTKNAILETELEHYKVYMSTTLSRHKAEKKRLSKTIRNLEREAMREKLRSTMKLE